MRAVWLNEGGACPRGFKSCDSTAKVRVSRRTMREVSSDLVDLKPLKSNNCLGLVQEKAKSRSRSEGPSVRSLSPRSEDDISPRRDSSLSK